MDKSGRTFSQRLASPRWQDRNLARPAAGRKAAEIGAAIGLGLALGAVWVLVRASSTVWSSVAILVAIVAPSALLVRRLDKLILVVLVIDIPLGLDIALANRPGHVGGPAGFLMSLMSFAMILGYLRWLSPRSTQRLEGHQDITLPALAHIFAIFLSAFQAPDLWFAATQAFLVIQFFLLYLYLANHVKEWSDIRLIVTTVAICLLFESILILLEYYLGFDASIMTLVGGSVGTAARATRANGTFAGPNPAATFLAVASAITFAGYLTKGRLVNSKLAFAALALGSVALVLTGSRSAWIAFVLALLVIVAQAIHKRIGSNAIALLLVLGLLATVGFGRSVVDRFVADDRNSATSRLWYAELALNAIRDHPLLGVGANNQHSVVMDDDYAPPELIDKERAEIHNTYLAIWVETGLLGFLSFVWLLVAAARRAVVSAMHTGDRHASIAIAGLLAALVVFAAHMLTASFTERRTQFLWLVFALIAATGQLVRKEPAAETERLASG